LTQAITNELKLKGEMQEKSLAFLKLQGESSQLKFQRLELAMANVDSLTGSDSLINIYPGDGPNGRRFMNKF
jgi:hypothetical protein